MTDSAWNSLQKFKDALEGDDKSKDSTPVLAGASKNQQEVRDEIRHEASKTEEIQSKEGWSDKVKDFLDGDDGRRKREAEAERLRVEQEKAAALKKIEEQRGFTGKVHDLFDGGKQHREQETAEVSRIEAEAEERRKKNEGLSGRIRDVLDGADGHERKVMEVNKQQRESAKRKEEEEGLGDKMKDLLHRKKTPPPPPPEHFSDKVKDIWDHATDHEKQQQEVHKEQHESEELSTEIDNITHHTPKEEPKQERSWLGEKFNEIAGGGAKSEANEDKLDKTIDFVQEHVLHKGDQSNESAFEQAKDEQISDGIRRAWKATTGHELPVKDKEH